MIHRVENAMGTVFDLVVEDSGATCEVADRAFEAGCSDLHWIDSVFSTYDSKSELSRYREGQVPVPSQVMDEVFELCARACDLSGGYFDPWAMDGGYDPSGLVKGWAVERAARIISGFGFEDVAVNGGGDIFVTYSDGLEVGIQHPNHRDALCGVLLVRGAVATSGIYERGNHLKNPFGAKVAAVSATVVGNDLAICDAMATALAVGGVEVLYLLENADELEGFFIDADDRLYKTSGLTFCET